MISYIQNIAYGWFMLLMYKLGWTTAEANEQYELKAKVCNHTCPLYTRGWCDASKVYEDNFGRAEGCGCWTPAKRWTDTACPLMRY